MHSVDLLSQFVQLGLVDGLGGLLPFGGKFGVGMVEAALSAPLRPILALRNMVALASSRLIWFRSACSHISMTATRRCRSMAEVQRCFLPASQSHRLVHEGLPFHGADTQAADDDVDVDVPCTVVPIRVGADDGGMTGEIFLARTASRGLAPAPWSGRSLLRPSGPKLMIYFRMASGACCAQIY